MTRRTVRLSALGMAAFAVLALVLGTLQVLVSPASSESGTTVAYAADFVDAPGPHLTEVDEGRYAWAPDAQHIATLEAQGVAVVAVAHQSLSTAEGVDAVASSGADVLFLGESFYRGFLSGEVVAALGVSGLDIVTVRAATFALVAPGVADPLAPVSLQTVEVEGDSVAVAGWATPVEAVAGAVDGFATRDDGGVVVGSAMVGGRCVSLFGIPWGASTREAGDLLGALLACGTRPADEAPVEQEVPAEQEEAPADEVPVEQEFPADEIADDGLVELPALIVI